MAISYEWNCKQVDYYPTLDDKSKVIYNVHWRLKGTSDSVDGEGNPYSAEVYGSQSLDTSDLSSFTVTRHIRFIKLHRIRRLDSSRRRKLGQTSDR
jgi:hypothetical protein